METLGCEKVLEHQMKFGLEYLFHYNHEHSSIHFFGNRIEVWWSSGSWRHNNKRSFSHEHAPCGCHIFDIGYWGITFVSKGCREK